MMSKQNNKPIKENRLGFNSVFRLMYLCHHVHVSMSPCFHVSIFLGLHLHVHVLLVSANKTKLTKCGNFRFSANRIWKRQASICLLQTEAENRSFVFFGWQTIIGGHRHLSQCRRYPISDIDICYSDIGDKNVGLKNVIPISEGFRYRHKSSFRYPT